MRCYIIYIIHYRSYVFYNLFMRFVVLKNCMIFVDWFSASASAILDGMLRLVRVEEYCMHSSTICLMVSAVWHESHIGWGSLLIKYEWVRKECPILMRVIAMSWRRLKLEGVLHFLVVFLIVLSLLVEGIEFQWFCQAKRILYLIEFCMSLVGTMFIVGFENI